jgi:hypothetical protein
MINASKIAAVRLELGLDELSAWRYLRDQARARKLYDYQRRQDLRAAFGGE